MRVPGDKLRPEWSTARGSVYLEEVSRGLGDLYCCLGDIGDGGDDVGDGGDDDMCMEAVPRCSTSVIDTVSPCEPTSDCGSDSELSALVPGLSDDDEDIIGARSR
eukprot:COSAG02_NODE_3203_length_7181_cov_2.764897_6_plen_105_part_00